MPSDEQQNRDYPVRENMRWQRIEWRIQHTGNVVLLLFVIAGACGFFSKGVVSNRQVNAADGRLQVEYERFGRRDSNMDMTLHLHQLQGEHYQLVLHGTDVDNLQIQSLQPQPDEAWSENNTLILRWQRRGDQQDASIWITAQPQTFGTYPLTITLDDRSDVHLSQFIYP